MNLRENYEALINHQETQWTPNATTEVATFDGQLEYWENGRQHDLMFDEVARCTGAPYMES